ncbi:unnamed protein product [Didymodactylos carnosus]|uniref:RING-type domain-containing protein n=1 Tax=Didymodactylos carnosus TaxID=1234261 RepID=A0A815U7D2_9BILA|nr:unnamed protein product [Didymodactylos carnosus]CAF1512052.1 unnamed protein product [Didymodactylos carnosus]CAF4215194.1 unnamed protein product [Didymodactylos carnosus]CAF4372571.1 unnamed protein product [Didymodactylos carnosus]
MCDNDLCPSWLHCNKCFKTKQDHKIEQFFFGNCHHIFCQDCLKQLTPPICIICRRSIKIIPIENDILSSSFKHLFMDPTELLNNINADVKKEADNIHLDKFKKILLTNAFQHNNIHELNHSYSDQIEKANYVQQLWLEEQRLQNQYEILIKIAQEYDQQSSSLAQENQQQTMTNLTPSSTQIQQTMFNTSLSLQNPSSIQEQHTTMLNPSLIQQSTLSQQHIESIYSKIRPGIILETRSRSSSTSTTPAN